MKVVVVRGKGFVGFLRRRVFGIRREAVQPE